MNSYKEEQRFNQLGLWIFLILLTLFPILELLYLKIFVEANSGLNMSIYFIYFIITTALMLLFYKLKLTTIISTGAININYYPFTKKIILAEEIEKIEYEKYSFVGYGIRFSSKGTVYNVKGNKGFRVYLKKGGSILIGTQQNELLINYLKNNLCLNNSIPFHNTIK